MLIASSILFRVDILNLPGKGGGVVDEAMAQETFVNEVTVAVWSHFPFPTSCDGETLATKI